MAGDAFPRHERTCTHHHPPHLPRRRRGRLVVRHRPRPGGGRRAAGAPWLDRLRRAGDLVDGAGPRGRRVRGRGRGRLLPRPGGRLRVEVPGARGKAVHRAPGLPPDDRGRRAGCRRHREPAVLPPPAGVGRGGGRVARLPGQTGGGRRAGLPDGGRGRTTGHQQGQGHVGRFPDARHRRLPPGHRQGPRGRAGRLLLRRVRL